MPRPLPTLLPHTRPSSTTPALAGVRPLASPHNIMKRYWLIQMSVSIIGLVFGASPKIHKIILRSNGNRRTEYSKCKEGENNIARCVFCLLDMDEWIIIYSSLNRMPIKKIFSLSCVD